MECRDLIVRRWRSENPQRYSEGTKRWERAHPERARLNSKVKSARFRTKRIRAQPAWADESAIRRVYADCPEGMHVDHAIPLKSRTVCGLHVHYNLQYLSGTENRKKGMSYATD